MCLSNRLAVSLSIAVLVLIRVGLTEVRETIAVITEAEAQLQQMIN
jgi:hypothetical protein